MKFDLDYIEKLVSLVSDSNLTELALENGDKAILLKKEKEVVSAQTVVTATPSVVSVAKTETPVDTTTETISTEEPAKDSATPILSPMVGTFYSAPSPGAKPFVQVGDVVSKGQVVCIIEAMKLMNEIEAEVSGKITKILVEDGQPVEYGQALMYVE